MMPISLLWVLICYYIFIGCYACFRLGSRNKLRSYISLTIIVIFSVSSLLLTQNILFRKIYEAENGYSNLMSIKKALSNYLENSGGNYPPSETWCDQLLEVNCNLSRANFIIPKIQKCDCNFAYNKNLDGLNIKSISEDTVVVFMSEGEWNLSGGDNLLNNLETVDTYVLLANGTIWRCRFPEKEIFWYDKNTEESYPVKLKWKEN